MNEQTGSTGVQAPQTATPTWMWGLVGAIVLLAGFGGGLAGYQLGLQDQGTTCTYQQTYWLLGASLADRGDKVVFQDMARGGPAASAGLVNGDELAAIDNRAINNAQDLALALAAFGLLQYWQAPPWLVVLLTAVGGVVLSRR